MKISFRFSLVYAFIRYICSVKQNAMKIKFFALLLVGVTLFSSCDSSKPAESQKETKDETVSIHGTWTLFKEDKNGKHHDYVGKPTAVSLTLKENGYFIYFDMITDEEMSKSGVDQIQERYKGQFELKDKDLTLNHFVNDSLIAENYTIQNLSADELVLKETKTGNIHYFKK